jgi:hypothetical protein
VSRILNHPRRATTNTRERIRRRNTQTQPRCKAKLAISERKRRRGNRKNPSTRRRSRTRKSLDERRGEEDQRDFKSAKEADSKGRKTERWRPGGGEEKPKEDQNAREERGRGDWGKAERRRERARDCGVERKETGTCTSIPTAEAETQGTIDFSSDNLTFTSRSFPSLRISETFTSEEREEEMQDAQEEDEEDEQEGEEG